jgi:hypothetical protein
MVLDGQLERRHAAGITRVWPEKVIVVRVAISGDLLSGKCFQV